MFDFLGEALDERTKAIAELDRQIKWHKIGMWFCLVPFMVLLILGYYAIFKGEMAANYIIDGIGLTVIYSWGTIFIARKCKPRDVNKTKIISTQEEQHAEV